MLKNLYTQVDFLNLTADDISDLTKILDIEIPAEKDKYQYLFEEINLIEDNQEANNIIANKLLAGQVTVKWYKYSYGEQINKDKLKEKLESKDLGFNVYAEQRLRLNIKDDIIGIVSEGNVYTLKVFIFDGYKRRNNGIESKREEIMKSITVKIDIENCWVEIRANDERCNKVIRILESKLGLVNLDGVRILNNYNNINTFKDSLIDGFYLNYKAAPSQVVKLTEEDGIKIANMISIIDNYFEDKNGELFLSSLDELDFDPEGLSFSTLLLAGVDSLGMKIRNDSEKDMSNQSLYTILKDNFIEDTSYIRFKSIPNGAEYTMRIGIKTNSIVFKSSVTEDVIEYIREKIL